MKKNPFEKKGFSTLFWAFFFKINAFSMRFKRSSFENWMHMLPR